jgi:hypothetical protein
MAIGVERCPAMIDAGQPCGVRVWLENHGNDTLASFAPFAVHLAYRRLDATTPAPIVNESVRSPVNPPLTPGRRTAYHVHVVAPQEPGRYLLRVTLVQEGVMWLDTIAEPVSADAIVTVV